MSEKKNNGQRRGETTAGRKLEWLDLRCFGRRCSLVLKGRYGFLEDGEECGFVRDGHIGEHLAVELVAASDKTFCKPAVGDAVGAAGGVETHDPEFPEVALADQYSAFMIAFFA